MEWIEHDGTSLRYDLREGGGTTLVLIHEMGGTLESWDLVMPLLGTDVAVLRYDTRGAGLSAKIRGAASMDAMADDVIALLTAAGRTGPIVLSGIAVGGAIAMQVAARHPGRVRGLVPFGPATGVTGDRRTTTLARAESVEEGGMASLVDASFAMSYPPALRTDAERYRTFRARWLANDPGSYAAILRMLAGLDMDADLARIACPTLVLAGIHDLVRPPDSVRPVADRVPGARFETIDSGHFASTQAPDLFAAALDGFLAEIGA